MCVQSQIAAERLSVLMLLVYGDESLDGTQSRVCAVAGVIGTEEMWIALESKWKARNENVPFHATDCDSDHGKYSGNSHADNKALYRDLTILLAESGLGGFASVQDLAAQRKAFPSPLEPPLYFQGFMDVLEAMRNAAAAREEIAEFTFDARIDSEFNATQLYAYLQQSGLFWTERLAPKVSFESSSANARIQAVDLFAREAMKHLDNQLGLANRPKRKSWECLENTGRFRVEVFGEQYFNDPKMRPEAIYRTLGFSESDYREWLTDKGFPPCYTSFIRFIHELCSRMTEEQLKIFQEQYGGFSIGCKQGERLP